MKSKAFGISFAILLLAASVFLISACTKDENSDDAYNYTIAEVLNDTCSKDSECETPINYLVRSSCPYTSKCIDNKCTVVCPTFDGVKYPDVKICGECPQFSPPSFDYCKDGEIAPGVTNECGCTGPPRCIKNID